MALIVQTTGICLQQSLPDHIAEFWPHQVVTAMTEREWKGWPRPGRGAPRLTLPLLDTGPLPLRDTPALANGQEYKEGHTADATDINKFMSTAKHLVNMGKTMEVRLLIHCYDGTSRAPALALLALALQDGPGREKRTCDKLASIASPTTLCGQIVALGDEHLGRNGNLERAAWNMVRSRRSYA